jgi:hypothetical protein
MSVAAILAAQDLLLLLLRLLYKRLWICYLGPLILDVLFFLKVFFLCQVGISFVWRCV